MQRLTSSLYAAGWVVLLSATWLLAARVFAWENAGIISATVFGLVVYAGFRAASR